MRHVLYHSVREEGSYRQPLRYLESLGQKYVSIPSPPTWW